jgi:CHAT domain-containing protein
MCGLENGRIIEGPFLCESYMVTRWVPELRFQQPLTMKNMAVVVPEDSELPHAATERDYLLSLQTSGRRVTRIPATTISVQDALATGEYDCWHFTGHGAVRDQNPDRSEISLEKAESLMPEEISGTASNLGIARPLVFLNACQVGKGGMSLTGVGGWAQRFLDAGAGAFIGPYWSIYDESAVRFARALYGRLLAGIPVGRAVKEARTDTRLSGDATWLAYTVFADPLASIQT